MEQVTAPQSGPADQVDPRPLDIVTMRAAAAQMLAPDAGPPSRDQLDTLTLQLRGHLMLLIRAIEGLVGRLPGDHQPVKLAMIGVNEARRRLDEVPGGMPRAWAHAQRLARSVETLCTHLERLAVPR